MSVAIKIVPTDTPETGDWVYKVWASLIGAELAERALTSPDTIGVQDAEALASEIRAAITESDFEAFIDEIERTHGLSTEESSGLESRLLQPLDELAMKARIGDEFLDVVAGAIADSEQVRHGQSGPWNGLGYDGGALMFPDLVSSRWHEGDERIFSMLATPNDVPGSARACWAITKPTILGTHRFQIIGLKETRPTRGLGFCSRAFEVTMAVPRKGSVNGATMAVGWHRGRWWSALNRPAPSDIAYQVGNLLGRVFCSRYEWSAKLCLGGPFGGVNIVCSPGSALELFRSRSMHGKDRRAALMHWVRAHKRKTGSGLSEVRKHLRGVKEFSWNGIDVTLREAPADREAVQ